MASLGGFNAADHDTSQRSTLPLGNYKLEAIEADVVPTKKGTGQMLKTTISVIEPESFKGRKMFHNMNIANDNPVAEKIGKEDLAKMCRAIGITEPQDSDELLFKEFYAKVGLESKPQEGYDAKNEIKLYYYPDSDEIPALGPIDAPPAGKARPTPAAAAPPANDNRAAAPAAKASTPWGKK